jgi:hypothetical protein
MIKVLKLITSEEIVGTVTINKNTYTIERPYAVMLITDRSTPENHSMALIPYCSYALRHTINVDKDKVVWMENLEPTIEEQYNGLIKTTIEIQNGETKKVTSTDTVVNLVGNNI